MTTILFGAFGLLALACALMVILHRNPVTSALFLVLTFCSLAGLYLLLQAEFLAMVQVIVYAGAIMVLFLFVIMYLNLGRDTEAHHRLVGLRSAAQEFGETRRASDDERQHAARVRIERAGVADAPLANRAPHPRHDVVRRRADGFIDDENAVHRVANSRI